MLRRYLSELTRHPSLAYYGLRHPHLTEIRKRAKDLDLQEREKVRLAALVKPEKTFVFEGEEYEYFYHEYNATWSGERTIEVPLIWRVVRENSGKMVLEVGNVLSHYFQVNHTIVDVGEAGPGVVNEDILFYNPPTKFGLVISISTLEHIGWSLRHGPRDPPKVLKALEKVRSLLEPGGKFWFTVPIGYNTYLDGKIREGSLGLDREYFMKRMTSSNVWRECDLADTRGASYGGFKVRWRNSPPFPKANAIMIGVLSAS